MRVNRIFLTMRYLFLGLFLSKAVICSASDSTILKVHFLYGSKPKKEHKSTELKWFGGLHGGHVGIETDSNKILNFVPNGTFHWFAKKDTRNSRFVLHNFEDFYSIFGSESKNVKKSIISVPISGAQKQLFDSIAAAYLTKTPYDYAFIGMRCGAAGYDILAQLGILPILNHKKMYRSIFYPKKLRKRVLKRAKIHNWSCKLEVGIATRKWEQN